VTTTTPALQRADEVLRRLAAAVRAAQLYSQNHPIIARNLEAWSVAIQVVHSVQPSIVIGLVGDEVIVDDMPLRNPEAWGPMIRRLQQNGVERVTISRGVTFEQLQSFVHALAGDRGPDPLSVPIGEQQPIRGHAASSLLAPFPTLPHIRLGRVSSERRSQGREAPVAHCAASVWNRTSPNLPIPSRDSRWLAGPYSGSAAMPALIFVSIRPARPSSST